MLSVRPERLALVLSHLTGLPQETLEEGCKNVDEVVESFADVGIKDRSMVWNTDLIEVGCHSAPSHTLVQLVPEHCTAVSVLSSASGMRQCRGSLSFVKLPYTCCHSL